MAEAIKTLRPFRKNQLIRCTYDGGSESQYVGQIEDIKADGILVKLAGRIDPKTDKAMFRHFKFAKLRVLFQGR